MKENEITIIGADSSSDKRAPLVGGCGSRAVYVIEGGSNAGIFFCPAIQADAQLSNGVCTKKECTNNFKHIAS